MADDSVVAAVFDFEELPVPAGIIDLAGTIVAVNGAAAKLLARPADELVGRTAWTFAPGIEHVWTELVGFARARGEHSSELTIATPKGARTIRYVMALRERAGRTLVLALALDVTRDDAEAVTRPGSTKR